jgi:hypothetical protein
VSTTKTNPLVGSTYTPAGFSTLFFKNGTPLVNEKLATEGAALGTVVGAAEADTGDGELAGAADAAVELFATGVGSWDVA